MDTKTNILETSIKTLSKKPRSSLDQIAAAAGVSRMTINRYFKGKDNLLNEAEKYCLNKFSQVRMPYWNRFS